jgi:sugar lactone lactonase YvrE
MKEQVRKSKHPLLLAVCVAGISGAYFYFSTGVDRPEPGPNLTLDMTPFLEVDDIETRFEEIDPIELNIEDPRSMAVDADGSIYVAGTGGIVVLDSQGKEIRRIAVKGDPSSIALGPDETIYLGTTNYIQVLSLDGEVQATWEDLGPKALITSLAISGDDVIAADPGNKVAYRFDKQGTIMARIGKKDPDRDVEGIVAPGPYFDVAFDSEDNLWVVNPGRLGLESYRRDGDIITSWYNQHNTRLDGFTGCCNPIHIAFNSEGKLITVEKGLVRVKIYEVTAGTFEELVAGTQTFEEIQAMKDLAVDPMDRILVLDGKMNAIRILVEKGKSDGQAT